MLAAAGRHVVCSEHTGSTPVFADLQAGGRFCPPEPGIRPADLQTAPNHDALALGTPDWSGVHAPGMPAMLVTMQAQTPGLPDTASAVGPSVGEGETPDADALGLAPCRAAVAGLLEGRAAAGAPDAVARARAWVEAFRPEPVGLAG